MQSRKPGFTLVEMSLVIVVIGLLSAGILVGRDLIRHAEISKLHRQYSEYVSAVNAFKTQYNCLPGDCANATDIFGANSSCPPLGVSLLPKTTLSPVTCNGDGDGRIGAGYAMYEMATAWQQLADAGLIGGQYTGGLSANSVFVPGVNCPAADVSGNCWTMFDANQSVWLSRSSPVLVPAGNLWTVMTVVATKSGTSVLTPQEAMAFDSKYDDGSPVSGDILVSTVSGGSCTTAPNPATSDPANAGARYLATGGSRSCDLVYRTPF